MAGRLPDILRDAAEVAAERARRLGVGEDAAKAHGTEVATALWQLYSGCQIYVPKFAETSMSERDQAMYRLFCQGYSIDHIRREFDVTDRTVYNAIDRARAALIDASQTTMFADEA